MGERLKSLRDHVLNVLARPFGVQRLSVDVTDQASVDHGQQVLANFLSKAKRSVKIVLDPGDEWMLTGKAQTPSTPEVNQSQPDKP